MRKLLLILTIILLLLINISLASDKIFSIEIGGVYPFGYQQPILLPYGELSLSKSLLPNLRIEGSIDLILLVIIPILSPSGRIILEVPQEAFTPYLGVGARNFISWDNNQIIVSSFVSEVFIGSKIDVGRVNAILEVVYFTSRIFGSSIPYEGSIVGRFGIEF